ncbi:MAG: carbohydrate ABC transporter substrate-binding protein [Caldilineaceae bacterium]|nr:carbohydrate ABC transporter substrate-binding protein [Caldilineaceae bacterium]
MVQRKLSRREFLQVTAVASVGLTVAACAAPVAPGTEPAADGAAGPYQGKFVIVSAGNPDQNDPLIKAIEAAHPGVEVEWRGLTSERYTELFAASEIAGDQIDMMDLNGQDLRRYAVGNKLLDLSEIGYKDRFREVGLKTYTIGGKLWALPRGGISGFPFLYNKKILDTIGVTEEPTTYAELQALAPELINAGYAPFVHAGKNIYLWPIWQFFAFAQTSGNDPVEKTFKTLTGDMKFSDPEHVAGLEILHQYARDNMFIDGVNSLDSDGAWLAFSQGKAAFWYEHSWRVGLYREETYPELDLSLMPPLRSVEDGSIKRMLPGGTGAATGIYAKIAPERLDLAMSILDLMTSDEWVKWSNDTNKDPVSTNLNVEASDDVLAVKYATECADNQFTYLDWYWPPEITRAYQENQQAVVAGTKNPQEAADAIQKVLDDLYADGYTFES